MPAVFSRPTRPLGFHSNAVGGRRVVLWPPFESMKAEMCPFCLEDLRRGEFIELKGCMHAACASCVLRYAASQWVAGRPMRCPLCRSVSSVGAAEFAVSEKQRPLGLTMDGCYRISFLEDCFGNWHCYGTEHAETGSRFVVSGLSTSARHRRRRTFSQSALCWVAPYHGWIVPNGSPDANAMFKRVASSIVDAEQERVATSSTSPRPSGTRRTRPTDGADGVLG